MEETKMLCPFCRAEFTRDMIDVYSEGYGCDTGCTTVQIEVVCSECNKVIYRSDTGFGSIESDAEREEYRDDVVVDINNGRYLDD